MFNQKLQKDNNSFETDINSAGIYIESVDKALSKKPVLKKVSLCIKQKEFIAVLGPSGCGKTTLLRLIAGFEEIDNGTIAINGRIVSSKSVHIPTEKRKIGIVFQNFALWPHMSVSENVGYSLKIAGYSKHDRIQKVADALSKVNLSGLEERKPNELSGGQRQRVALARCLVAKPDVILLDEPLANLDIHLRASMEEEFINFHKNAGASTLYVTHDQSEAMSMADRIAVMHNGRIVQFAPPEELFNEPADEFTAQFIGNGRILSVENIVSSGTGFAEAELFGQKLKFRAHHSEKNRARGKLILRAKDLRFSKNDEKEMLCRVVRIVYRGIFWQVEVRPEKSPEDILVVNTIKAPKISVGEKVSLQINDGWILPDFTEKESSKHQPEKPFNVISEKLIDSYETV